MMVQRFGVVLLAMVVFVGCGGGDEPDIDEAPKTRITWEKDGARMELIPAGFDWRSLFSRPPPPLPLLFLCWLPDKCYNVDNIWYFKCWR